MKSPEQMDEILATIDSEDWSDYIQPVRDEKYDEAFFENKSLVISLNVVGGGNCSQSIDALTVKGNVLTVYRTIYQPMWPTPDMNYQYVLIEVNNSDIRGVNTVTDSDSVLDPQPEYITIYFENTQNWAEVNVYYWDDNPSLYWPGVSMNLLCQSSLGFDVYTAEIPANSIGVVFNSTVDMVQTEDYVGLFDEMIFYPAYLSERGCWCVDYVLICGDDFFTEPSAPTSPLE